MCQKDESWPAEKGNQQTLPLGLELVTVQWEELIKLKGQHAFEGKIPK